MWSVLLCICGHLAETLRNFTSSELAISSRSLRGLVTYKEMMHMSMLIGGSVAVFSDNTITVTFSIECENELIQAVEKLRFEEWLTYMAKREEVPFETLRRDSEGGVEYGKLT